MAAADKAGGSKIETGRCAAQKGLATANKGCTDATATCEAANKAELAKTPPGTAADCTKDVNVKKACDAYNDALTKSGLTAVLHKQSIAAQANLWNPDYLYKETLKRSDSITEQGSMNGYLVFCLFLSYLFSYFSAWKGIKSTGKMVWVTCTLPYFILTVLLIKGITLEGSSLGLRALFVPKWELLSNGAIWKDAAVQILFSSGVSFGPLMFYGSARKIDERILKASFWIPMANSLTSLYAALTVFLFLGHVSHVTCLEIDQIS